MNLNTIIITVSNSSCDKLVKYTIPSIKKYIDNCYIIIVDNSMSDDGKLETLCDYYLNTEKLYKQMTICLGCNHYIDTKRLSEQMITSKTCREFFGMSRILSLIPPNTARIYKINENFVFANDIKNIDDNKFTFFMENKQLVIITPNRFLVNFKNNIDILFNNTLYPKPISKSELITLFKVLFPFNMIKMNDDNDIEQFYNAIQIYIDSIC